MNIDHLRWQTLHHCSFISKRTGPSYIQTSLIAWAEMYSAGLFDFFCVHAGMTWLTWLVPISLMTW